MKKQISMCLFHVHVVYIKITLITYFFIYMDMKSLTWIMMNYGEPYETYTKGEGDFIQFGVELLLFPWIF